MFINFQPINLKGRNYALDLEVDRSVIINCYLGNTSWVGFSCLSIGSKLFVSTIMKLWFHKSTDILVPFAVPTKVKKFSAA